MRETAPFVTGSDTSREAAKRLADLNEKEKAVLDYLESRNFTGATDEELADHFRPFGWAEPTARARRVALWHKGKVRDSGWRRYTRHGLKVVVWVAL